jgi:hypothetical protein
MSTSRPWQGRQRGASIVEFLIVGPLLIFIGMGLVQTGLVFHAKSGLNFALQEGARVGSVNFGDVEAIERGIKDGLIPYMGGGENLGEIAQTRARVEADFQRGAAAGWIRVQQLSPTPASFTDWAEDSYDEDGRAIREIPNANLSTLRCTRTPNGGRAGSRSSTACAGGEPIGADSQQTLADANLLKLKMTYGVKLGVPLVSRIVGGALSMAAGCDTASAQRLGPVNLDAPQVSAAADKCAYYNAVGTDGEPEPRIPVELMVTVRMQTPARFAGNAGWFARVNRSRDANTGGVQLGNGEMYAASQFAPIPVSQLNPDGVTAAQDQFDNRGNGALHFGADSDWERLGDGGGGGFCPAPPPANGSPCVFCNPNPPCTNCSPVPNTLAAGIR